MKISIIKNKDPVLSLTLDNKKVLKFTLTDINTLEKTEDLYFSRSSSLLDYEDKIKRRGCEYSIISYTYMLYGIKINLYYIHNERTDKTKLIKKYIGIDNVCINI